jgi:hypothetical protein
MELSVNKKIQIAIISNLVLLLSTILVICKFADKDILRVGYSKDLIVLGVTIDSLDKYLILQFIIFLVEFFHSIIYEFANPIMYFQVFDSKQKYITDFTKLELQLYAQSLWFITSLKNGFMLLVSITQIDITICKIIYSEIAVVIVIRNLLNQKVFVSKNNDASTSIDLEAVTTT